MKMNKAKLSILAASVGAMTFAAWAVTAQAKGEQGSANGQPFKTLSAEIEATKSELEALSVDVTTLEGDISMLDSTISVMQGQLDQLESGTNANPDDIADLRATISELETELLSKQDAIEGGCPADSAYSYIFADGSYTCAPEADLGLLYVFTKYRDVYTFDTRLEARCPFFYKAIGGGFKKNENVQPDTRLDVESSYSMDNTHHVDVRSDNDSWEDHPLAAARVRVQAVCIPE